MMTTEELKGIRYTIDIDPMSKPDSVKLHLWRCDHAGFYKVATFNNHYTAGQFAKEFDFPLSDSVKKMLYPNPPDEQK